MERYVCIHGHFYQPPRENPWLEEVEGQDSAYPYHDWNERVCAECYAPNTVSRILSENGRIVDLVNNYSKISFNLGPTLLSWMERRQPQTYQAILEADREGRKRFSGHGTALAQAFGHIILPLANSRDKRTQILWALADFEYRFQRRPEGMWLPETAVDLETLDIMAEQGIAFTILSPNQAAKMRKIGGKKFHDVSGGRIDPRRAYCCKLPSGRTISLFFYDGAIASDVAFGGLLNNGEEFSQRLMGVLGNTQEPQLAHVATDGESYGHHHRHGDMALAYCLQRFEESEEVELTVYGEYLEKHPPQYEVKIHDNSSWSCAHGVERWRSDCGCSSGGRPQWHQGWRAPLRGALDWLRENMAHIFEQEGAKYMRDPWRGRDAYVASILDRSRPLEESALKGNAKVNLEPADRVRLTKLLEMQRHAMLMYTSCGWFFDEISGIETVQVMQYAARAIQLAREISGVSLEDTFRELLSRAPSNMPELADGRTVYDRYVAPTILDFVRVGAHFAVSSLFEQYAERTQIYCYSADFNTLRREERGGNTLSIGKANLNSTVTGERQNVSFAAIYFGDYNISGGVRALDTNEAFEQMQSDIMESFDRVDITAVIGRIEHHFGTGSYSLWHLFKDEQRRVFSLILRSTLADIDTLLRQVREHHYPVLDTMRRLGVPFPAMLARVVESVHNNDILSALTKDPVDAEEIRRAAREVRAWSLQVDKVTIGFEAGRRVADLVDTFGREPDNAEAAEETIALLDALGEMGLEMDLWRAQNTLFALTRERYPQHVKRAEEGDEEAQRWVERYRRLAARLNIEFK